MIERVIKRDGTVVPFDINKIVNAVTRAFIECEKFGVQQFPTAIINANVRMYLPSKEEATVEEIQDSVERALHAYFPYEVAKAYMVYRSRAAERREQRTKGIFKGIINTENNEVTRENANMNSDSPAGMMMKFASETTKPFVDNELLSKEVLDAVNNNYIHIHDKDYYPTRSLTCLQHPLDKILANGFKAGHGESRGAKRIETAAILAAISMETIQNEMHGGQAIPAFDFYMAPYVKFTYAEEFNKALAIADLKDEIHYPSEYTIQPIDSLKGIARVTQAAINATVGRVHQAMESFIHNMNSIHSRGGNQVVFSSINYGTDTSPEGRCVMRELLLSTERGVGNGATAIFPIQIFKRKTGVNANPSDPNYDLYKLSCKVTAKRFFPNFINLDATYNQHELWNVNDPLRYNYECATINKPVACYSNIA